jgi:hypothetical protein
MQWHAAMLRHVAILLGRAADQTQTGDSPQHRLELKEEQESGEQGPHGSEHYRLFYRISTGCGLRTATTASGVPANALEPLLRNDRDHHQGCEWVRPPPADCGVEEETP